MGKFFLFGLFISSVASAQTLEFKNVTKLPSTVNSSSEEVMPLLSPNGKTLFFSRVLSSDNEGGIFAGQDVWSSDGGSGSWKKASNKFSLNNKSNNVIVGINKDGKTVYLVDASRSQKMNGIFFAKQQSATSFSRPELIPIPGIGNLDFIGFFVSPDFDVIFLSMKAADSKGEEDLYFSVKDVTGLWSIPKSLGATINTPGFEISPFLSADKKRLYFASNGHTGQGDADIFYSERLYDTWETWSVPVNLGPAINSKKFDAYFSTYGDSIAFFSSNRDGKYADIYQAKVSQGKTILAGGQRYFTDDEWASAIGKSVSDQFAFPHKSTTLTPSQKELLFYIADKVMLERGVEFHLVVKEEEDSAISKERLNVIMAQMKKLGIDETRIHRDQIFPIEKTQRGVVELMLIK